jgi:hypothetical protein
MGWIRDQEKNLSRIQRSKKQAPDPDPQHWLLFRRINHLSCLFSGYLSRGRRSPALWCGPMIPTNSSRRSSVISGRREAGDGAGVLRPLSRPVLRACPSRRLL